MRTVLWIGILIALAGDDLRQASQLAEGFPETEEAESFPNYLLLTFAKARLLLAQDQRVEAMEQLAARYARASRAGWESAAIQTRALQALAAPKLEEALGFLTDALRMAKPEGYVRTFLDLGEPMADMLRQAESRGTDTEYVSQLLAAFEVGEPMMNEAEDLEISSAPMPPGRFVS